MTSPLKRRASPWGAAASFAAVLTAGIAGLMIAAASDQRTTAFSVQVPGTTIVAVLAPGQDVCQTSITVRKPFNAISAWMPPGRTSGARFVATVRYPGAAQAALRGALVPQSQAPTSTLAALEASLPQTIRSGQRVTLCVKATGHRVAYLMGGAADAGSGALVLGGKLSPLALSLVFRTPHPLSLLALLPTVFSRAGLFRFRWVGAWVYWALLVALLAGAALMAASLAGASAADGSAAATPQAEDREQE